MLDKRIDDRLYLSLTKSPITYNEVKRFMKINEINRNFNRNIFFSKLYARGLTLEALGALLLNPRSGLPVSKNRVSDIINNAKPDWQLKRIAVILDTNVPTLWPKVKEAA